MNTFAQVANGTAVVQVDTYNVPPPDGPGERSNGLVWLPYVVQLPLFNPDTEKLSPQIATVEATRVLVTATVIPLTGTEIDTAKTQRVTDVDRAVFQVLFRLVNDVRALQVPPQPPLTVQQFKNFVKGLL